MKEETEEGEERRVVNNPLLVTLILWISLFAQPPRRDESEPRGNARARSMHLCMTRESSNNIFLLLSSCRDEEYAARCRVSPREESYAPAAKRFAAEFAFAKWTNRRVDGRANLRTVRAGPSGTGSL